MSEKQIYETGDSGQVIQCVEEEKKEERKTGKTKTEVTAVLWPDMRAEGRVMTHRWLNTPIDSAQYNKRSNT